MSSQQQQYKPRTQSNPKAGAEREEDEDEIAFGSAFGVVIGWCLG